MVVKKVFIWWLCFILFTPFLDALPTINVSAEVQWNTIYENQPIKGTLTITRDLNQKVNKESFKMSGKPLKVDFVQETKIAENSPLVVDIYSFEIPGMSKGLQMLPAISVEIDGKPYESIPSTFEVLPGTGTSGPYIKLENIYQGEKILYPGQRALVGYRYSYNASFDLTKEELPLLYAENLKKVGEKEIKNFQSGNLSITEITQYVEAAKAGEYKYGPSVVAGIPYTEDNRGNRTYLKTVLSSEAPVLTIQVDNFPIAGKPASFNGAVGQFDFAVNMETPHEVREGDEVKLKMTVFGKGQLEKVLPPDLCCQPGFSGLFKNSDLPPVGQIKADTKIFQAALYPTTPLITAIPSIEFSWFDPVKKTYEKKRSVSIPLTVLPSHLEQEPSLKDKMAQANVSEVMRPLLIAANYFLENKNLRNRFFGSFWVIGLIPLGCLFIFFQLAYKREKEKSSLLKFSQSDHLFKEALAKKKEKGFFALLEKAFDRLVEEKNLEEKPEELKQFFDKINRMRFSGKEKIDLPGLILEADRLFNKFR